MKFAFTNLACPNWSLEEVIERAKQYGYDGVELRLIDGNIIDPAKLSKEDQQRVRQLFSGANMPICCLDTSLQIATSQESAESRKQMEDKAMQFIEIASDWGAPMLRVFGGKLPEGMTLETVAGPMAESLQRIGERGEQRGVRTLLETHDSFSSGKSVATVLNKVKSPYAGALWDTHHPYRTGETAQETWELIRDRLYHVHIKDAERQGDGWKLVLLGAGEVPVREVVQTLKRNGYDGYYSVEWEKKWHPEIEEPEVALPQHIKVLREYLSE